MRMRLLSIIYTQIELKHTWRLIYNRTYAYCLLTEKGWNSDKKKTVRSYTCTIVSQSSMGWQKHVRKLVTGTLIHLLWEGLFLYLDINFCEMRQKPTLVFVPTTFIINLSKTFWLWIIIIIIIYMPTNNSFVYAQVNEVILDR